MRAPLLISIAIILAGCTETGDLAPQGPNDPVLDATWPDLAEGLFYNGTGPTALVAQIMTGAATDCLLSVQVEYNSTGHGLQLMTQFREYGAGSMSGSYNRQQQAIQVGPVDTRTDGASGPRHTFVEYNIDGAGVLFIGVADAQPHPDDPVAEGTVRVASTCSGSTGDWTIVGVDPIFFTSETPNGTLLISATPALATGAVVAAERAFTHNLNTSGAVLVANVMRDGAGLLELTSPAGTETWNLATDSRRIWHEGPGGAHQVTLSHAGSLFVIGVLFGAPDHIAG